MLPRKFLIKTTFGCFLILCLQSAIVKAADNHSCYHCEQELCEEPVIFECRNAKNNDKCFIQFDSGNNDVVQMGCLSDFFEPKNIEEHIKNKTLFLCDGVNCNDFALLPSSNQCTECSSLNEETCAIKPETVIKKKSCNNIGYTQCYQRVNGSVTERGCLYDLEGDGFYTCLTGTNTNCKICEGRNCNEDIIPSDRKRCHRCNTQTDAACESTPSSLSVCPSYNKTDICVSTLENGITKRGCQTEFTCDYKSKNCHICARDGCNSYNIKRRFEDLYGIFQDLPLNCYTCKGDDCEQDNPRNPNKCEGDPYQDCMTVFDTKEKVIQRGCELKVLSDQQSHCSLNPDLCFKCKSNGCNDMTDSSVYQECLYCDAATNPDCLFKPNAITTTRKCTIGCVSSLYPRKTSDKVQDFVRTCVEDIEPDNRDSCTAENNCIKCFDDKCNTGILPDKDRLSCLHCNGTDCDMPLSTQCVGYNPNDMCYIYFDNTTSRAARMGCRSDIPDNEIRKDIKQYYVCDGDNCNDYSNLPEPLFCTVCDSEDDVNCAINATIIETQMRCRNLPYTQCYVRIRDGKYTERGCLSDLSTDDFMNCHDGNPNSKCSICTADNCNRKSYPYSRHLCHRCNSTTDANCEASPNVVQPCPLYQEKDACITQWVNRTTIRACASETSCDGLGHKNCRQCSVSLCNDINLANEDIGELGLFTSLPLRCHQCNGTSECSNNTNLVETCGENIYQSCTTIFNTAQEVTARGCSDKLESKCSVNGNTCFQCKSNSCNAANELNEFIDCLHCDAKDNENCVFDVKSIKRTRKCYKSCITALYPRTSDTNPVYELVRTCLDDKDLNDRNKCESSKDPNCKSCTEKNCNIDILGSHKSCYQCKGDECKSPKIQTCRAVTNNDQCFMQYDDSGALIELGCKSKYNSPEVDSLVKQKQLWLCDEDNCNNIENIPQSQNCITCDSTSNEKCATHPNAVSGSQTCAIAPYTQCYQRVNGSVTVRGCLYDLEFEDIKRCLTGKDDNCKTCEGNNCNKDIIPSYRKRCHRCNSQTDNTCESSPSALSVCPSYNKTDICVSTLENGITKRGCQTEFTCDYKSKNCQLCARDGCNSYNIKRRFEDLYGIFQDLPLNCYTCKGDDCEQGNPRNPNKCEGDPYQDCMTVFDTEEKVIQRGCEFKVLSDQQSHCSLNPDLCFKCKSNGCNDMTDSSVYQECLYCDAATNPDCLFKPNAITTTRKCTIGCVSSLYPRKTSDKVQDFVRTCVEDIEPDNRDSCTAENNCIKCFDDKCNTAILPDKDRLSCLHCNGSDCDMPHSKQCVGYNPNDMCYIYFDDITLSAARMGCRSDIPEDQLRKDIKQFFICDGDNCNDYSNLPEPLFCTVCDSEDDVNCAINVTKIETQKRCRNLPYTQCYVRIRDGTFTERGCLSDLSTADFVSCHDGHPSSKCRVCTADNCNRNIYPESRHWCHRCNSTTDANCEASPNVVQPCPLYQENDACITQWVNRTTIRACASETTCDGLGYKNCRKCSGFACNDNNLANEDIGELGLFTSLPLRCHQCNGTSECSNNTNLVETCGENIYQSCTTIFNTAQEVTARGCSDKLESKCSVNGNTCFQCKSNSCNAANELNEFIDCLHCDAKDNEDCVFDINSIKRTRKCYKSCITALYPRTSDTNPVYELVRTCLDDKDLNDRNKCESSKDPNCKSCTEKNCNIDILGSHKSCYQCKGDECKSPKIQTCRAVTNNDQCFMQYDDSGALIELGCKSKYNSPEVDSLVKQKQLWLCDEDNCNNIENIPQSQNCITCDSTSNEKCATHPNAVSGSQTCAIAPYTQCYQRVNGSVTVRGCLYDLEFEDIKRCLTGKDDNCKTCEGNNCNKDIIPSYRKRCHRCNSQTDNTCESSPSALSVCPSYNKTDICVSTLENGITKRGCQTEFTCDYKSKNCQLCARDGCNSYNIKRRFEDLYGIFQDLPLNCYTCKGDDCEQGNPRNPNKCEGDPYQDCMTVFDTEEKVIQRGCEFKVLSDQQSHCSLNPDLCFKCKSNGCNDMTDSSVYQECLYCDAATNPDCLFKPNAITTTRKCTIGCVSSLYPRKTSDKVQDFVRTCVEDIEPDNRDSCTAENNCIKCFDDKCNTGILPDKDRLSCLHCNGTDCDIPHSKQCVGYNPNDMCYIYFDDITLSATRMGCRSDIPDDQLRKDIKQFFICDGDNCNDYSNLPEPLFCTVCDSEDDVNCAINVTKIETQKRCRNLPYTQCYVRIRDGTFTERGCLSDLSTADFVSCHDGHPSSKCSVCTADNCNRNIYPYSRHWCHRCNSTTYANCEASPNVVQPCPLYQENDACITQWVNATTIRACASETTCDGLGYKNCRKCSGFACNDNNLANEDIGELGLFTSLPLRCHQCNGTSECSNNTNLVETCGENIYQSCTTIFNTAQEVTARGCSDKLESKCSVNGNTCFQCKSNSCNAANELNEFIDCLHCDAKDNEDCVFDVKSIKRTRKCYKSCITALYPRTSDTNPVYELVRTCLDDKDLNDRNKCESSKDPNCKSCTEKNCNIDILGSHKSCYQCKGDECKSPKIQTCRAVTNNDQCFMQYDDSGALIELGCKSKYNSPEVDSLVKQKQLWLCDEDNCNNIENIPQSQNCITCDSTSNEKCATHPNAVSGSQTCAIAPYTQCYQRVNGSVTVRGCLYDLEFEDIKRCLTGKDDNCKTCEGNNCNKDIIPSYRKRCHRCNSQTDNTCESSPSALSVCPSYNKTDICVSTLENGITKRGCQTEFTCDYKSKNCQLCARDGCNSYNIKRRIEDLYGIFQDLPLNCYTCKGDDCEQGNPRNPNKCEGDPYQDCMTVFDTEEKVIQRGCEFKVLSDQQSHCSLNPDLCFKCKANGCNDMTDSSVYQECLYCDAATNPDCLFKPNAITTTRKCTIGCVSSLYPRKTSDKVQDFVRTCVEDIEPDNRDSCTAENNCIKCFDDKCNTAILPDKDRLSCLHCNGTDCDIPHSKQCVGYNPNDMCYIYFDDITLSATRMGCRSDIPDDQLRKDIKQFFICDGDNCNDYSNLPEPLFCTVCDSEDDVNCAINVTKIETQKRCRNLPYTQCYVRIRDGTFTERGCLSDLSTADFVSCHDGHPSSKCRVCTADNCNRNIYPESRHWCHRCNSTTDANCEASPNVVQPCPLYQENDACITQWVNATTIRACASETTCDGLGYKNCRKCSGFACNDNNLANEDIGELGLFTSLPLRCHQCNGTSECSNNTNLVETCGENIYQSCITIFNDAKKVIARGCSDNLKRTCSDEGNECFECKSNSCNVASNKSDYIDCLHCDAKDSENCIFNASALTRTRKCYQTCMTALYPRTNEENPVYELVRTCLDDKDVNDRNSCESAKDPKCISCTGKNCNTDVLGSRKSCYQCKGEHCLSAQTQTCRAVADNDQCFIEFDERGAFIEMGCRSKYNPSEVDILVKQKRLWLCDADNCNTIENIPKPQTCVICNSRTDTNCATKPNVVYASTTCGTLPYTECYSRILENGHTERGCLSNLEGDELLDCLSNKNSTKCLACSGNNCNQEIFPTGRRSCQRCNSKDDPECENSPSYASICPIYSEDQYCSTKLVNGHTYRGCSSEFQCDDSNKQYCRLCNNSDNCNTVNLAASFVGDPGKWQELPLSCHHCKGKECRSGNDTLVKCEGNNLQTCMTVFDAEGIVVERGCSDTIIRSSSEYCNENADKCFACKSNACNNAKSLDDYVDCYFCDSSENSSCAVEFETSKSKTRKCQKSCMVALYPNSSGNDTSYELTRTCLDDMDLSDRNKCAEGNKELCKVCNGPLCNTMNIPDDRFECYKCTDEDCEDMAPKQCSSYHPNEQCYVLYNEESSIVSMGCRSDLESSVVTELVIGKQLLLCKEKNCNTPENLPTAKLCSVCNSADNPLCATNPNLVNNITRCAALPYTQCFTRVNGYGHTERGCLGNLEKYDFYGCVMGADNLCETCIGDKCNEIDVYPKNRRTCQHCDSITDSNCLSLPNNNKVCELYREDDYCITSYNKGITTRGCKSSMECENEGDPISCRACKGDNCNTINMKMVLENGYPGRWQDIPISCYTCKSETECSSKGDIRPCLSDPLQNCMTVFNATSGKVFQRGCSDSVGKDNRLYCSQNPDKCLGCNSNGCNEATGLDQYVECLYCDAETNHSCISNTAGITVTRQCYKSCMSALYPRFEEENPSYGLIRSCYDDMDYDDRNLCEAGNKKHCKVCNTPKCNIIDVAEKRHSCYVCEGDGCNDPKLQACSSYRPDDKCYTRFDERNNIIALGCRSQFSNEQAVYLIKQKRLFECNGENCNTFNNIPKKQSCILCSSLTNNNCAVNITAVRSETECEAQPYTHCYSRVLSNGATERGCLSNLYDDEFLGCLNGTSATCKSCQGNYCNNEVFPATRLACHTCDSSHDPNCEAKPNSLSICSIYDPEDTCVTAFRNNITYRGCSSNVVCDINSPLACQTCSGDGCNTFNLAKQDINFGIWQDLPLSCLTCSGEACSSEATTKSLVCQINNKQDCMTVFNDNGKVIARGCSDSIENEFCSGDEANCYRCKSNKCNTASSKSDFEECVYCNSYNNQDCIWNPLSATHKTRKCDGSCMTALYPSYGANNSTFDLIRTCLNDKELFAQNTCTVGKDKKCSSCSGNKCNTKNIPEDRLSCFACKGESCQEPESKLCPLYRENDRCFIKFDETNSISEMGCISSFKNQDLENIIKTKRVHVCSVPNCNNLSQLPGPQTCAVCNSANNTTCAINPTSIGTFSTCSMLPYTSCYTKLNKQGRTERGCLSDLPSDDFTACVLGNDNNCDVCNGNGCNREIFPRNRLQCYTCETSEQDRSCESFPTTKQACPIITDSECATALSGNVTVRGCKSLIYCDANDTTTCRSCFGSECNSIDLLNKQDDGYHGVWQELPLKCHTCEGDHCLHSLGPLSICSSRNINQDCMTVFDEQGLVERRGCSDDVENYRDLYCRINPERCFKCKSNECNIAWSMEEYINCLFCDSTNEPSCLLSPVYDSFKSRKCYKNCMVAMRSEEVIRSCLDDKEMWVQHQCKLNNTNECSACSGNNCNHFVFPSDRLKCHVCNGPFCSNSVSQYCEKYDSDDFCFAKYENGRVDLMGCASSQKENDLTEWTAQNKLYKCDNNDCNALSNLPKAVCLSCDSNKNPYCAQNPLEVSTTETCPVLTDKCFIRVDDQGHTIRGCLSKFNATEQSCESSGTCTICEGEKCNNQIYPSSRRRCHICNSTADKNCKQYPSSLKVCPIYDFNEKCVSTLDSNGFFERGCFTQVQCSINNDDYCNICNTNGCNTVDLKGSANIATNSIFLIILLAFASFFMLKY